VLHTGRNCTEQIVKALGDAKTSILVQAYSLADFLANQGVPTMIDANHAISYNKVRHISDGEERHSVASIAGRSCTHPTTPTPKGDG
jgi:hypothetical protein